MKSYNKFIKEAISQTPLTSEPKVINRNTRAEIVNTSSYGPGLYGNKTASGQVLTPNTLGVANKNLPLGTKVRITDPTTKRVVNTKVIDRGPYEGNRKYDLTDATAKALGYSGWKDYGVRKVDVTPY